MRAQGRVLPPRIRRVLHLPADESDRLSRVARVAAQAVDVLGSEANAVAWLRQPNRAPPSPLRLDPRLFGR